jgi:signal transduction histidine kinase
MASINQDRLEVALDCLLENSVKFTVPGDRIEVEGIGTADSWTIVVADSGAGMSPERVEALFNAGGPPPPPSTFSGTGLGLAIVRAVVTSWGGSLQLHSEPPMGTTVSLVFSRVAAQQPPTDLAPAPAQTEVRGDG